MPRRHHYGRGAPVAVAVAGYGAMGGTMLALGSLDAVSTWTTIWVFAALQGVARCAFENTSKTARDKGCSTSLQLWVCSI